MSINSQTINDFDREQAANALATILSAPYRAIRLANAMYQVAQERRQMRDMDARMATDMGLSLDDLRRESELPFWVLSKNTRRRFKL